MIMATAVEPIHPSRTVVIKQVDAQDGGSDPTAEDLALHPAKIFFKGTNSPAGQCTTNVQLSNLTDDYVLYKLKASQFRAFKIQPGSVGLLFPKSFEEHERRVKLTLVSSKIKDNKFENLWILMQTCCVPPELSSMEGHELWKEKYREERWDANSTKIKVMMLDTEVPCSYDEVHIFLTELPESNKAVVARKLRKAMEQIRKTARNNLALLLFPMVLFLWIALGVTIIQSGGS